MEPLEVNGNPPSLAGRRCDAILCQQYWYNGRLAEPSNVAFLCFDGTWTRLSFDHGIIFWRADERGPEPFEMPEFDACCRIEDVATPRGLVGVRLLRYNMTPTERGSRVTFVFEDGRRLMFDDLDDITSYQDA